MEDDTALNADQSQVKISWWSNSSWEAMVPAYWASFVLSGRSWWSTVNATNAVEGEYSWRHRATSKAKAVLSTPADNANAKDGVGAGKRERTLLR